MKEMPNILNAEDAKVELTTNNFSDDRDEDGIGTNITLTEPAQRESSITALHSIACSLLFNYNWQFGVFSTECPYLRITKPNLLTGGSSIVILADLHHTICLTVLNRKLNTDHPLFNILPTTTSSDNIVDLLQEYINILNDWQVCEGSPENKYKVFLPHVNGIISPISDAMHSEMCELLTKKKICPECAKLRVKLCRKTLPKPEREKIQKLQLQLRRAHSNNQSLRKQLGKRQTKFQDVANDGNVEDLKTQSENELEDLPLNCSTI